MRKPTNLAMAMPRLAKKAARIALRLPSVTGQGWHMGQLDGRVALVSGGGRGIGRGISERLASEGAAVAVNYRRDRDAASATVAAITATGGVGRAYEASVDDAKADATMVADVLGDFGFVDLPVANAGVASRGNAVADTDPGEVARLIATHAVSAHHLAQLAHGIHVNVVAPGLVETEMGVRLARAITGDRSLEDLRRRTPPPHSAGLPTRRHRRRGRVVSAPRPPATSPASASKSTGAADSVAP